MTSSPEDDLRLLQGRLRKFTEFALAQEELEAAMLDDDGPWFDRMPEEIRERFDDVQRLRNEALGI